MKDKHAFNDILFCITTLKQKNMIKGMHYTFIEVEYFTLGQYGTLTAYVTPRLQPKCCQVSVVPVLPGNCCTSVAR